MDSIKSKILIRLVIIYFFEQWSILDSKIRILRDSVVIHDGTIGSLKRFKDEAKEVLHGYECGVTIEDFNDIKINDIIETYDTIEQARKL